MSPASDPRYRAVPVAARWWRPITNTRGTTDDRVHPDSRRWQLTAFDTLRWLERHARKGTLFMLKGDAPGSWRTVKTAYSPVVKAHLVRKYGDQLLCIGNDDLQAAVALTLAKPAASAVREAKRPE